jgi:hypothetical protein
MLDDFINDSFRALPWPRLSSSAGYDDVESTKLAIKEITSSVKSWKSYGYNECVLVPGDLIVSASLHPTLYPSTYVEKTENPLENLLGFSALIGTVLFQDKYGLIFCGGRTSVPFSRL